MPARGQNNSRKKTRKRSPKPPGVHPPPAPITKSKRSAPPAVVALAPPPARRASFKQADQDVLNTAFAAFYHSDGRRRTISTGRVKRRLYSFMGKGGPGYLTQAVTKGEFDTLVNQGKVGKDYTVQAQDSSVTNDVALAKGDYFHVISEHYTGSKADRQATARRIIVNVKDQRAALAASHALAALFTDRSLDPYFRSFKVYLSATPDPNQKVKYDKLVVYYQRPPGNGPDTVGDQITGALKKAVPETDRDPKVSAFYAILAPGLAWAQEPKYYLKNVQGSFTESRRDIIAKVIEDNPAVTDENAFAVLVEDAFQKAGVDPRAPHRHL
ncbi:T3SS effector HopA1 family protein [Actinomadura sp. ATCC 31491]|uniref:T3SS effector HopA1 family protein n=1 Tax=Actinomadura luzonensis TaxID=2805427 RepID=A0ABT0G5V2_9ACTN|nr:T3SS effector HopA1 family protein [Actinomadura luzonensis]MCK2219983.1 T3SS effector HopA1 family protein [Actinomadura luzonensis]